MPDIHYLYGLFDPRDNHIFYIGRTKKPANRCAAHVTQMKIAYSNGCITDKDKLIEELCNTGMRPRMVILEHGNKADVVIREYVWWHALLQNGFGIINPCCPHEGRSHIWTLVGGFNYEGFHQYLDTAIAEVMVRVQREGWK